MLDILNRDSAPNAETDPRKKWKWIIYDSLIIGGIAMAASMPSAVPCVQDLWVMFKAFFAAFILQVAIERGLRRT